MCLVAARLSKILFIELLNSFVLVRLTNRHSCILIVESLRTKTTNVNKVTNAAAYLRLSTAVYTAARTCHDLNELIISFAVLDLGKNFVCILKTGSNSNLNLKTSNFISSFLDAFGTTNFLGTSPAALPAESHTV